MINPSMWSPMCRNFLCFFVYFFIYFRKEKEFCHDSWFSRRIHGRISNSAKAAFAEIITGMAKMLVGVKEEEAYYFSLEFRLEFNLKSLVSFQ